MIFDKKLCEAIELLESHGFTVIDGKRGKEYVKRTEPQIVHLIEQAKSGATWAAEKLLRRAVGQISRNLQDLSHSPALAHYLVQCMQEFTENHKDLSAAFNVQPPNKRPKTKMRHDRALEVYFYTTLISEEHNLSIKNAKKRIALVIKAGLPSLAYSMNDEKWLGEALEAQERQHKCNLSDTESIKREVTRLFNKGEQLSQRAPSSTVHNETHDPSARPRTSRTVRGQRKVK